MRASGICITDTARSLTFYAVACLAFALSPAYAGLVNNGGFETGDFSDWSANGTDTCVGSSFACQNSIYIPAPDPGPHSGSFAAYFGDYSSNTLSQTITDTAGDSLVLSFYLAAPPYDIFGSTPNGFAISFGGNAVGDIVNDTTPGYQLFTYNLTGSGSDLLQFTLYDEPSSFVLDDVSITDETPAPEPATFGLIGVALAAIVIMRSPSVHRAVNSEEIQCG